VKALIFIPPKDFRDESVSLIRLFFDKWGVNYRISSYTSSECVGMRGASYSPQVHTSKVTSADYDAIVLIDGNGIDNYKLYDYRPLLDLVSNFHRQGKYIIGIDNAAKIPARANIVKGRLISFADSDTKGLVSLFHGIRSDKQYAISDNLITIRSSGDIEEAMHKILEHMRVT